MSSHFAPYCYHKSGFCCFQVSPSAHKRACPASHFPFACNVVGKLHTPRKQRTCYQFGNLFSLISSLRTILNICLHASARCLISFLKHWFVLELVKVLFEIACLPEYNSVFIHMSVRAPSKVLGQITTLCVPSSVSPKASDKTALQISVMNELSFNANSSAINFW